MHEAAPYRQALKVTRKKPIGVKWVDLLRTRGKHRRKLGAKGLNSGDDTDMLAPTTLLEGITF